MVTPQSVSRSPALPAGCGWIRTCSLKAGVGSKPLWLRSARTHPSRIRRGYGLVLDGCGAITRRPRRCPHSNKPSGLYRRAGDASGLTYCLIPLGGNLAFIGRYEEAESVLAEVFPLLERAGAPRALAQYFAVLGFLKMRTGDPASARVHYEKALSLYDTAGVGSARLDILGNLADISWALGDLDAALAGFRETVALLRKSPLITKVMLGIHLGNLAGVLIERGELDEALTVAREGLPMLKEWEYAPIHLDHVALRAALVGKVANAARVAGFADSIFVAKEISRQPNEARARDRLQALLTEKLAAAELERLLAEGAKMTEDEACRLALEE